MDAYCTSLLGETFAEAAVSADFAGYGDLSAAQLSCVSRLQIDSNFANAASEVASNMDTFFLLYAASLVFFMQAGFGMLCAGSVRSKNVKNIMLKNCLDAAGGAIGFWAIGWGIAYGDPDGEIRFAGTEQRFAEGIDEGTEYILWFFQWSFAAAAATIVAGSVAERCKFEGYLIYSFVLTGIVYPVIVHAGWSSSGYISAFVAEPRGGTGAIDFAGSGIVHMTGGLSALVGIAILGPRNGRFYDNDGNALPEPVTFPPNNVALQCLGTFILWFGWYGFNPGSALAIYGEGNHNIVGLCAATTTLAAAAGGISALFFEFGSNLMLTGEFEWDINVSMNGILGGLVGITAGCSVVTLFGSIVIGLVAGVVYVLASKFLVNMKLDDAVDAIPVHAFCGLWGVIAVGLFAEPTNVSNAYGFDDVAGLFYGGNSALLGNQIILVLIVTGWVLVTMGPLFTFLKAFGLLRVEKMEEEIGLDFSHHKGAAYNISNPRASEIDNYNSSRHLNATKKEEETSA